MSLNATPSSERVHIGIFGKRNAGKSSLINAITGQNLAIVSEAKGTTTDPVYKAMELLPLGPVMIIDTPGIDDEGVLGSLRIQKAYQVLNKTDIALVIIDAAVGPSAEDLRLIKRINTKKIPLLIVINKCETINEDKKTAYQALLSNGKLLFVSAEDVYKRQKLPKTPDILLWFQTGNSNNLHHLYHNVRHDILFHNSRTLRSQ